MIRKISVGILSGAILSTTLLTLNGCVPLVIGGAVSAGYIIINDRRTTPQMHEDIAIKERVLERLNVPAFQDNSHLIVAVYKGRVLLAGQTPTERLKEQAQSIALTVKGVNKLYNEIDVSAPTSTLTRASDEWIRAKVRMNLIDQQALKTAEIDIIVENGTVYLMGEGTQVQQKLIISAIRKVAGVERIENIFIAE